MGYLAAYNTSSFSGSLDGGPINIAISSSIFSGSTGAIRFGDIPFPPSGGMTIISDSNTQLGVASASATPLFWAVNSLTDTASVLNTINALPERVNQTRFTTTSSAYLYLVSSSKYFPILGTQPLNTPVTDRLALYLNAGQLISYPTTASTWYDISGNNNNGSLINSPTFDSVGAIVLDGVDDYITAPSSSILNTLTAFTYTALLNISSSDTYGSIIARNTSLVWYAGRSSVTQRLYIGGNSTGDSNTFLPSNKYTYICVTWDGTTIRYYFNGVPDGTATNTSSAFNTTPISIGRYQTGEYFQGKINNVGIYNRALSQAEINQNYYQAPIVTDGLVLAVDAGNLVSYESGSTNTYSLTGSYSGSLTNGTRFTSNNGGTFLFDGIDDYINVSTPQSLNPGTGSFSLDFWCNISTNVPTGSASCLLEARANNLFGFLAIGYRNDGRMQLFINDNVTPNQNTYQSTTTPVQRGVWVHEAMVVDRSTQQITFYYNGLQTGNKVTITDTGSIDPGSGYRYWIGGDLGGAEMNGEIAISRQYNKALTAAEVSQNFNAQRNRFNI
jgi:hypothetical protein